MPRIVKLVVGQVLLLLGVLLLATLAAEWVVRQRMPELRFAAERQQSPQDLFVRFDATYGWSNIPGADVRFQRKDFDTRVRINEQGFRGPAFGLGTSAGPRIAVLGDSYVFGHGVEEDETFAARLRDRWPGSEVGNFGVIGYSTDQELLLLQNEVLDLDPQLVILCLYRNDILDNGQATAWGLYRKPRFVRDADGTLTLESKALDEGFPLSMRLRRALRQRFVLYDVVAFRLAELRTRGGGTKEPAAAEDPPATTSGPEQLTRDLILRAASLCRTRGVPFLLVVLPGIEDTKFLDGVPPPSIGTRLELGPILARYEATNPDSALGFTYDTHWNPRGHRLVAEAIAEVVESRGWLVNAASGQIHDPTMDTPTETEEETP